MQNSSWAQITFLGVGIARTGRAWAQFGGPSGSEQVLNCNGGLPGESVVVEANTVDAQWRARLYNRPMGKMTIDGPAIAVGMWTHLALVYDDSRTDDPTQQAIFYVDGTAYTGDATGSRTHGDTNVWPNRLAFSGASCTVGCHGSGTAFCAPPSLRSPCSFFSPPEFSLGHSRRADRRNPRLPRRAAAALYPAGLRA
jgi:hypothetical protein